MLLRDRFAPRPLFLMAPDDGGVPAAPVVVDTPVAPASDSPAAPVAPAATIAPAAPDPAAVTAAPALGADGKPVAAAPLAGGDLGPDGKPIAVPADWPADWREKLAGEDKGFLNTLKRYGSPKDVAAWIRDTQRKISAGELKAPTAPPPKDATPEQMTAWRKEQGLPTSAAEIITNLKLGDGVVPGEADKPLIDAVATMALERGYKQEAVNDFVGLYYQIQDGLVEARNTLDGELRASSSDALRAELGADFPRTMNALKSFWSEHPPELRDTILGARTEDGRMIGDIPEVTKFLAGIARELNPAAAILPAGSTGDIKAVTARKSEIEATMYAAGKPNPAYWGNEKVQAEYRDLLEAEQKMAGRAA